MNVFFSWRYPLSMHRMVMRYPAVILHIQEIKVKPGYLD
jgi:hypothetical protein